MSQTKILGAIRPLAVLSLAVLVSACGESGQTPTPSRSTAAPTTSSTSAEGVAFTGRPNVVVFLVDTLRADALGFAGYERDVSPRLDAWAERGVVFEQATTPSGWTKPAVASLFSGLYPASHGVQDKDHVLNEDVLTWAEVLKDNGYTTQAFITNFAVHAQFGVGQGFDEYRWMDKAVESSPDVPKELNYVPIADLDDEVRGFLSQPHSKPFLLYVHSTDPHFPYLPPPEHDLFGAGSRDRYDGEVRNTDHSIGGWMDFMERRGLLDRTIVILTADHGEEFLEHGFTGHGITVFDECVRVPLVVWAPGATPGRRTEQVSLADIAVSTLEGSQILKPSEFAPQGRSFWPLVTDAAPGSGWSWSYHELVYPTKGITFAYRENSDKSLYIVEDRVGRKDERYLFDLSNDPTEQINLAVRNPSRSTELSTRMRAIRQEHLSRAFFAQQIPLDDDAVSRLRALGYID